MIYNTNRFSFDIPENIALMVPNHGPADSAILATSNMPVIAKQLATINQDDLKAELKEYGAWDNDELSNHAENIQRILWIACCEIKEQIKAC